MGGRASKGNVMGKYDRLGSNTQAEIMDILVKNFGMESDIESLDKVAHKIQNLLVEGQIEEVNKYYWSIIEGTKKRSHKLIWGIFGLIVAIMVYILVFRVDLIIGGLR